jgi:tetraacyldisaccharide 4'-kinase
LDINRLWQLINAPTPGGAKSLTWLLRGAAWGASLAYGLGAGLFHASYDSGLRKPIATALPVIGVGNISVGGAGKTPLTIKIVECLQAAGIPAAVISRGHGRKTKGMLWVSAGDGPLVTAREAGDEPYLLARRLSAPVLVGPDRAQLVQAAYARLGPRVIVGDDLFQHRRLYRDLDVLALDARAPLSNGYLLPRGPLREKAEAIRRAQVIVLTNCGPEARQTKIWLRSFWGSGPVLECRHIIKGLADSQGQPVTNYAGRPVLAFCGLANPAGFAGSLSALGLKVVDTITFADHHWYNQRQLQALARRALAMRAEALVTSEKDMVRVQALPDGNWPLPLWSSRLDMEFSPDLLGPVIIRLLLNSWRNGYGSCGKIN